MNDLDTNGQATKVPSLHFCLVLCLLLGGVRAAGAQTTAFTYQGRLTDAGNPANGNYDLQFKLFDALAGGSQQGLTLVRTPVTASAGNFTVTLDFGANVFSGSDRFLEIGVRPAGSANAYTVLAPRQQLTSVPYAIQTINAQQLGGLPASGFVQNTNTQQAGANFNIAGNGAASAFSLSGGAPPAVAPAGQGRLYFDTATNKVKVSENGAAFVNLVGASGVSGSGTVNTIPLWSAGTTLGDSVISQSAGIIGIGTTTPFAGNKLDVNGQVLFRTGGGGGGFIGFGSPSAETGMTITGNGTNRADLRFDGAVLKLVASSSGIPPATNGIAISTSGRVGIGTASSTVARLEVVGDDDPGVFATSDADTGVYGFSTSGTGVYGISTSGTGVFAISTSGEGVYSYSNSGYAGLFNGKVRVTGVIEKAGGGFKIDHPLDPENKYLVHSFVESPDMKNLYDGAVTTDANGEAEITLPDWFAALNRDFRYQLTCIGVFAQAIIAEKIKDNRFKIKTSLPNVEVSWQVTGTRQDAWANQNRLPVEEAKPEAERGFYQNPTAFGQPEERSFEWARHPEKMKQQKVQHERGERVQSNQAGTPAARPNQQ